MRCAYGMKGPQSRSANGNTAATPGVQFTPPVAFIHLAIVQGAVYDAVNAIKGGHDPLPERTESGDQRVQGRGGFDSGASCPDRPRRSGAVDGDLTAEVKAAIKDRLDANTPARWPRSRQARQRPRGSKLELRLPRRCWPIGPVTAASARPAFRSASAPGNGAPVPGLETIRTHGCATCGRSLCRARNIFTRQGRRSPDKRPIHGRVQ